MIPLEKKGLTNKVSYYFPRCVLEVIRSYRVALILLFEVEKNPADKVKLSDLPGTVVWWT